MKSKSKSTPPPLDSSPKATSRLRALYEHGTLRIALLGALLLWLCLPPVHLAWLAWIAPVPWLWLARLPQLPGRRPYWAIFFAGCVFWTATNHWLRLPHPAIIPGFLALSWYSGAFPPLIVGLMRVAAKRGISIVVSGPVLWLAADQARAYMWTGFSMSSLCHSQYRHPEIIQFADVCGEFGVTFLMVVIAASIARALPIRGVALPTLKWLAPGVAAIVVLVGYSAVKVTDNVDQEPPLKIALVQGSISSEVKHDPDQLQNVFRHYVELTQQALKTSPDVQLIAWPETMFPYPYWQWTEDMQPRPGEPWTPERVRQLGPVFLEAIAETAKRFGKPMLLGVAGSEFDKNGGRHFNSALLVDAAGKPMPPRYDKRHRVIFGEFIPMADWFPWLYTITPLTGGIQAGARAETMLVDGYNLAPNICYETALARVILRQVNELRERGAEPDVLVNLTNDSWFRGSSELDLHLACGVFRAVEMRKPLVIAANTGFSAHIDEYGTILQQSSRGSAEVLIANVRRSPLSSPYRTGGNWLPGLCLAASLVLAGLGLRDRRLNRPGPTGN